MRKVKAATRHPSDAEVDGYCQLIQSWARKQLRAVARETPWQGLHPHAFRRLVATQMDTAGASAREIADYLGHERVSMTQDVYMSRGVAGDAAMAALERLAPPETYG
jgi:integrase